MHAGELEVQAADDVLSGSRQRHAALAALVFLDGLDDGLQQAFVGFAGLGETPPKRATLPHHRQAQQVQERGVELVAVEAIVPVIRHRPSASPRWAGWAMMEVGYMALEEAAMRDVHP